MSEIANLTDKAREILLASLLVSQDDDGAVQFEDGAYIDWSVGDDDHRQFEFGDENGNAVRLRMPWHEIERFQRALTLTLLNRRTTT